MIAAKAFDPVLGIDIHIIQPPPPAPPVPVPHPFIGLLIDPFDFAPIIGSTVSVNGLPRATAGTGGMCIPSHIPIGGTFVKPPANECDVFMGSSTVLADDEPLSFLGMPALSCQDIGIPPIPRRKKKRRVKSLVLPTSVVLAVPMGAPVLVGGAPTVSMMALGMRAGMAGLGKAFKKLRKLKKASRRMKALSDKIQNAARKGMNKLGVPPSLQNKVHRGICSATGHPVDVATGKVFTDAVDLHLPGPLPFDFERVWYSASTYQGPLGHGWHHSYDMALLIDSPNDAVTVRAPDGRPVAFPTLEEGESYTDSKERLTLVRDAHGYALHTATGSIFRFAASRDKSQPQVLASVEDRNGNALELAYDASRRLTAIRDSAGRVISLESDAAGRLNTIWVPDPEDPNLRQPAVSYRYSAQGDLVEVRDAVGNATRYEYVNHLLIRETDRGGLSFRFAYDGSGPGARCIHTWGDGGLFTRALAYDLEAGMTIVTDSYEQLMTYYWNPAGLVERMVTAYGEEKQFVWDDNNNLIAEIDPLGNTTTFDFDEWGNRTKVTDALGASTKSVYNAFHQPREEINAAGDTWKYGYDHRGNLASVINPLGRAIRYVHDSRGLPLEIDDAAGGISRLTWDERGDLVRFSDTHGATTQFLYDALGRLTASVDALGQRRAFSYDAVGQLIRIDHPDGSCEQFAYDALRRLIAYADPLGHTRQFRYASGDRPIERIDSTRRIRFEYDLENRLVGIVNQNGARYSLKYDANDNLISEVGFDGRTNRYEYNSAGQLIRRREGGASADTPEHVIEYVRDSLGRLQRKILPDGGAEFAYDAVGRLVQATNASCDVSFRYDEIGNLLEERQGEYSMIHEYDAIGNRARTTYPQGEVVTFDFEAPGHVRAIGLDGRTIATIQRDALYRERSRTQGAVESTYDYDPVGRLKQHRTRNGASLLFSREYGYDLAGRLTEVTDSEQGRTSMAYDALGRLTHMLSPQAREVLAFDPADNLIDANAPLAGGAVLNNRLITYRGIRFEYDVFGNIAAKRSSADRTDHFRYDSEHQLLETVCHRSGSTERTEYAYDALGRRIAKRTDGAKVEFVWSTNLLLQERSDDKVQSFIYGPRSFVPLVSWNGDGILHFHCDPSGTPRELTRHDNGKVVWRSGHRLWGKTHDEESSTVRQPFRYPGQYHDGESGLHYNRFRYFDPDVGRYLTQDPVGLAGGFNPYAYSPDPVNYIDPLGLQRRWLPLGDGWEAGVDQFNTGGRASHEIHVYAPGRVEVGVVGPDGEWIPKHGHPNTRPPSVSDDMCRRIHGINVDQLRREGHTVDRTRKRPMFDRTCGR
ncbi:MAG: hypothetical protein GEV06_23335 [Luteitalea sp.]|nr:hypothetical protein [Luteitalea sp.]